MYKDPAFLFYPKDWLEGTAQLLPQEKGVYIDLLCYQHQKGSLPIEPSRLARMAGLSVDEFKEIWEVIKCKFVMENYTYINKRIREDAIERANTAKKKRIAGIYATLVRQNRTTPEIAKKIKEEFSIDNFMQFSDDTLQDEITKWYMEWLSKW